MSLFYLFLLGVVGTSFALILFNKLIQITTPVFASTTTYIIPIAAVMWGIIDNEALYPIHFLGMTAIIIGVYIVNRNK
jgi:drug/metabolite transporter (DMT)-like permease